MNAYDAAQKNGKEAELHGQLVELAKAQNKGTGGAVLPPEKWSSVKYGF